MGLPSVGIILECIRAQRVDHEVKDLRVVVPARVLHRSPGNQEQRGRIFGLACVVEADKPAITRVGLRESAGLGVDIGQDEPRRCVIGCSSHDGVGSFLCLGEASSGELQLGEPRQELGPTRLVRARLIRDRVGDNLLRVFPGTHCLLSRG